MKIFEKHRFILISDKDEEIELIIKAFPLTSSYEHGNQKFFLDLSCNLYE